jgi:hypothetical protein
MADLKIDMHSGRDVVKRYVAFDAEVAQSGLAYSVSS